MPVLGVNIDHVATLRQARGAGFPDPVKAALVCQRAGADSIVAHLREDRRHIQDTDVLKLSRALKIKFNVECSIDPSVLDTVLKARPDAVTFVPERRRERTTEAGLAVTSLQKKLSPILRRMRAAHIGVSLFIDPHLDAIRCSRDLGVEAVEIHTGDYANAKTPSAVRRTFKEVERAVENSLKAGLVTHVGHGLDYQNVSRIARIPGITEFNIGYSIITRALDVGLAQAVREMVRAVRHGE